MVNPAFTGSPLKTGYRFISEIPKLQEKIKAKENRVLYWIGDWTKKRMEWKLSKSPPTQYTKKGTRETKRYVREIRNKETRPPYQRTKALRNLVRFAVDEGRKSVVIGPEKLNRPTETQPQAPARTVPELLDIGGNAVISEKLLTTAYYRNQKYTYWKPTGRRIVATYRAFPYVGPARNEAIPKLMARLAKERL